MIVSIAGLDGAGKSTIAELITRHLEGQEGVNAKIVNRWDILDTQLFPSCKFLKPDLKLMRTCVAEMPVSSRMLFLAWCMRMSLEPHMESPGRDGVLLLDSYWMKHAAVEITYGADSTLIEGIVSTLPRSDLVVWLVISPADCLKRKKASGDLVPYECDMDPACSEDRFLTHQAAVAEKLAIWGKNFGWLPVDAMLPRHDIVRKITSHILGKIRHGKEASG